MIGSSLPPSERNHRAIQALLGLVLVCGVALMYVSGRVEQKLTDIIVVHAYSYDQYME